MRMCVRGRAACRLRMLIQLRIFHSWATFATTVPEPGEFGTISMCVATSPHDDFPQSVAHVNTVTNFPLGNSLPNLAEGVCYLSQIRRVRVLLSQTSPKNGKFVTVLTCATDTPHVPSHTYASEKSEFGVKKYCGSDEPQGFISPCDAHTMKCKSDRACASSWRALDGANASYRSTVFVITKSLGKIFFLIFEIFSFY